MSLECDRLGGINLSQGVCDTEVPISVRLAAQSAIDHGHNTYTAHTGILELRQAIATKIETCYGMKVDADHEVVVSGGSTKVLA
jgi:aminotransferase